jgi:D-sedoheptulose 7-phosphate isomerase
MSTYGIQYMDEVAALLRGVDQQALDTIFDALLATYERDGMIFICGNGGSATTASHFACDLCKWTILPDRRRVRASALVDHTPLLTAWANDSAYEHVFAEQLANFLRPGDLVLAISGSGNSPNVLNAVRYAREQGCATAALCGFEGGKLAGLVDYPLIVRSRSMPQIEDVHQTICHLLATRLREELAGANHLS